MKLNGTTRGLTIATLTTLAVSTVPFFTSPASAAPGTLSLVATSDDGAAFDLDEYAAGDLTVQVTDSIDGSVDVDDAQDLQYHWTITPFDTSVPAVRVPATGEDVESVDAGGEFVVPLPAMQAPGTYALVAGLGPDGLGGNAITAVPVLTVKAGNAEIAFDDEGPLLTPAGADRPLAGALRLEDGTGLPDRLVDLAFARGAAGNDPDADAVLTSLQATTDADGSFAAVLSDPAEDGQGTELGGVLSADTAFTPDSTLDVDLVSENPPADSTAVVGDPGGGTPGEALTSGLTVTAPDDTFDVDPSMLGVQGDGDSDPDPVEGQVYSLTVDHGFFTTGDEVLPSVVGDPAGNLVDLGQTLTGLTDADGEVAFQVAIGRDAGFDDDGLVAATVTAAAGDLTEQASAAWDSADPFNGGAVQVALSPRSEQVAPVDPAVAGDITSYDVFTLDQFGNRVTDQHVVLGYDGDLDDYDYSDDSVDSDFDRAGDLWVVSFEAAAIDVSGTWTDAPTYRYVDTAGNAVAGSADVTGSTTASFYELDFNASRFSATSTAKDVVAVGSTVRQTVSVVDQLGNPVRGYRVQFFRFGPDAGDGEPRVSRVTNDLGQASYTFVGTELGRARVTAEVTDGVRTRTLTDVVVFGAPVKALLAREKRAGRDRVAVTAQRRAAGARVTLYRVVEGKRYAVRTRKLTASGTAPFTVRDRNGRRFTTYVALVRSTPTTVADYSNGVRVR